MAVEHINETDFLNDGRVKINKFAIDPANRAEQNSKNANNTAATAVEIAKNASNKAENVQDQLTQITIEGDSSVEAAQARVAEDNTTYQSLKDRLDNHQNHYEVSDDFDLGGGISDLYRADLETLHESIDQSKFNLLIETDVHYEEKQLNQYYDSSYLGLNHLNNALYMHDVVDVIVANGDNCQSDSYSLENIRSQYQTFVTRFLDSNLRCDAFINLGNHDDGSGRSASRLFGLTLTNDDILHEADLKELFRTKKLINGETREGGDSLYCFKDYPDKKIRLINLNSSDIPDELLKENGTLKYLRWNYLGYREKQMKWLANVALSNVPEDYHVVITAHSPLKTEDWSLATNVNAELVKGILVAFKYGSLYQARSVVTDFEADFTVDFTAQGPRNLVGFFSGHLHHLQNYKFNEINNICFVNSITASREVGTKQEDAFAILEIDTDAKVINVRGFGAQKSISYTY
ncbi:hypothetical protein [Enterococcus thailandicus]|uniref:hypothetical protein n=1 Tax=Enterococcus thailandicus TaxID=417368 RepID=UPI0035DBEFFD